MEGWQLVEQRAGVKGAPHSGPGCSQSTQVLVDISDPLHGLARCRCVCDPSPFWKRGHKTYTWWHRAGTGSFQAGGRGVAQERANSVLWSTETAPKAMERIWLVVKWGCTMGELGETNT